MYAVWLVHTEIQYEQLRHQGSLTRVSSFPSMFRFLYLNIEAMIHLKTIQASVSSSPWESLLQHHLPHSTRGVIIPFSEWTLSWDLMSHLPCCICSYLHINSLPHKHVAYSWGTVCSWSGLWSEQNWVCITTLPPLGCVMLGTWLPGPHL